MFAVVRVVSRPPVRGWSTRLGIGGGLALAAVAWGASPAAAAEPASRGTERPELATAASRSFRQTDGSIVKRFYGDPVNVKDAQGRWRHIDTGLARDGATLKARTTRVPVTLPKDLANAPVTVGSPGQAASVSPVGLAGTATVAGDTASYVDRSRGVETRLAALPDGVKQSYVLRNTKAPSRLDVALRVSAGFSVRKAKDGGATVVDSDGKARFELSPTFAWPEGDLPKARPVPTEIVRDGNAWRVRLDLSSRWIRKALEHGPVVVDPTLSVPSPVHDAVINSQFPTYNAGWSTAMGFVATAWKQSSPHIEFRSLLRFDLNDLPQDADVLSASIGLHVAPHSPVPPSTGIDIAMHEATSDWESDAATWISRLPTASWTVPGGDYVGSAVATATNVRQTDGWREWGVTSLVRRWASGASANHGVVLKAASVSPEEIYFAGRTATGAYADQKPYLQVHYAPPAEQSANNPGTGDTGFFTFRPSAAVGGTQINVASGNLLVRTRDLADSVGNFHVVVDRAYNSLAPDTFSILSPRWGFDVGPATRVAVQGNGDALVTGPSGYKLRFVKQTDGTFTAPADFDGSLVKTASGWTLNRTSQGDQFGFDNSGTLTWTKDAAARDFTVQGTSAAGRDVLSSYGTSLGQRVNLSYTGDSLVREMDDPSSGHHYYRYTNGRLTTYESPSGQITSYRYDSNGLLDKIIEPGGTTVELDLAASGRVRSITTTLPGGFPQTTSFVYTRRPYKSDVTGPDSVRRTYAYDADWRVTRQYNPDIAPTVTPTGELFDLADDYVGPNRTYPLTVTADQPDGAGLRRLAVEREDGSEVLGENVPCTTTPFDLVCPTTHATALDVDFSGFPEGALTIRAAATDDEEHQETSDVWTVLVDKTPPAFVSEPSDDDDEEADAASLASDSTDDASMVSWPGAEDPDLADGTAGSDVDHYRWRYRASSSASWSAWTTTPDENTDGFIDSALSHVELQVVPVDSVGNAGSVAEWSIDEVPQGDAPVPDYVPNPTTFDDPDYEEPEESEQPEGLVEDESPEPSVAGKNVVIKKLYRCKQPWTPIQATASGFVIGNCAANTPLTAFRQRTFTKLPGHTTEGRTWVAGSFPNGGPFKDCAWISTASKRVNRTGPGSGRGFCKIYSRAVAKFMHKATRRASVPDSSGKNYPRYHTWATRAQNPDTGRWEEKDGLLAKVTQPCRAYANINPWRRNQTASGASTEYTPGKTVFIRYLSRYQAKDPATGVKKYWIMTHTRQSGTPWLWLPDSCKFDTQTGN